MGRVIPARADSLSRWRRRFAVWGDSQSTRVTLGETTRATPTWVDYFREYAEVPITWVGNRDYADLTDDPPDPTVKTDGYPAEDTEEWLSQADARLDAYDEIPTDIVCYLGVNGLASSGTNSLGTSLPFADATSVLHFQWLRSHARRRWPGVAFWPCLLPPTADAYASFNTRISNFNTALAAAMPTIDLHTGFPTSTGLVPAEGLHMIEPGARWAARTIAVRTGVRRAA